MENVKIEYADLPASVGGMVVRMFDDNGNDDYYTIVLNCNKTHEENVRSCRHELEHLGCRDFDSINLNVDTVEYVRHGY